MIKPYTDELIKVPDEKAVLQVMFFLYEKEAKRFIRAYNTDREEYKLLKKKFAKAVKKRLIRRYPEIKDSIKTLDVWTPASYKRYFGNKSGAFMSFAMKKGKAVFYRLPSKVRAYGNVFIATQWQGTPGGLPTAALNGKRAIDEIQTLEEKSSLHAFRLRGAVAEI